MASWCQKHFLSCLSGGVGTDIQGTAVDGESFLPLIIISYSQHSACNKKTDLSETLPLFFHFVRQRSPLLSNNL